MMFFARKNDTFAVMKTKIIRTVFAFCGTLFFVYYAALMISDPGPVLSFSLVWPIAGCVSWVFFFAGSRIAKFLRKGLSGNKKVRVAAGTLAGIFIAVSAGILVGICLPVREAGGSEPAYLLVLGGGIRKNGEPSLVLAARLDKAAKHPDVMIIVSGGKLKDRVSSEARSMANYLETVKGIKGTSILEEGKSLDTIQNFRWSLELIRERAESGKERTFRAGVCVLTSGFHLRRALFLARRSGYADTTGLAVTGLAAPCPPVAVPNSYLREIGAWWKLGLRILAENLRGENSPYTENAP